MSSSFSKNVVVLGTGGTIAGLKAGVQSQEGYDAAQLGIEKIASQSQLQALLQKEGLSLLTEQVAQIDSKDMARGVWYDLSSSCKVHLADPNVAALVITHGTDTLAETAYLLSRLFKGATKPLVITGAMRAHDDPQADGPSNLRDSVDLSLSLLKAKRAGVWVVFDGVVHDPMRVRKMSASALNAFHSFEGDVFKEQIASDRLLKNAPRPPVFSSFEDPMVWMDWTFEPELDAHSWPEVGVLPCHADMASSAYLNHLFELKSQLNHIDKEKTLSGLIISGMGSGTWPKALESQLMHLMELGLEVVLSSQVPWGQGQAPKGAVLSHERFHFSTLEPNKARIALMLHLLALQTSTP